MARIEALDLSEARASVAQRQVIPGPAALVASGRKMMAAGRRMVVDAARQMTSDSTLAQLGGGSGWGGFNAAKWSRLQGDWPSASRSADQDLVVDLRRLRARARQQALNSPTAAKFLGMVRTNVVGQHGVKLAFKVPTARKTKNNGGLDATANEELRKQWHKWGKKGSCTVCGRYSWKELQRLVIENVARDGECLLRKVFVSRDINPFGFQLQLIDADQLDDTYNQLGAANNVQIRMGVEVDPYQKPVAYYLFNGNPYEVSAASAQRVRVPADQIIHFFIAHRTGQSRGFPWFAASMGQLKMLDGYFEAELAAARISSSLLMSIETDEDGDDEFEGDGINADGTKAIDVNGGMALEMPTGQRLKNNTPTHPTQAFSDFVKQSGRLVASGMSVAYHKLCNDLAGINYSSGRLGELEEREYWMEMQGHFIEDVLEPVYETWQKVAQINRAIDVPFDLERYINEAVKWEPRRWPWVDPLKDVQASTLLVQNGFETHESILNSQGRDLDATYGQLKEEQDLADELGLALGTDIRGQGTSEVNNEDETPEGGADAQAKPGATKPGKPKVGTGSSAPAKPRGRALVRGMHPANAALWDVTAEGE